jgi:putative tricarboxylic transport membrane protein
MKTIGTFVLATVFAACFSQPSFAYQPTKPECLAPAKPGGGFDLTCRLVSNSLLHSKLLEKPMLVTFMPGGVGAVAYNHIIGLRGNDANVITAVSPGSVLNLAQGKFGQYDENAVRWLAGLGADYGAVVVLKDAPWQTLGDLLADLKKNPGAIPLGSGGSVGSQDWMKSALLAKSAGVDPRNMRYVAFEGGGEALTALLGGHIKVYPGDVSELAGQLDSGKFRVLAVLSDERLPGKFSQFPTAKEQGHDVVWTIWRGYYLPPKVSDEEYNWWVGKLTQLAKTPEFAREREERGLYPFTKIGKEFDGFIKQQVVEFRTLAKEAGLIK